MEITKNFEKILWKFYKIFEDYVEITKNFEKLFWKIREKFVEILYFAEIMKI